MVSLRAFLLISVAIAFASDPAWSQPAMSTFCYFTSGLRAGQTQNYAPLPPLPVGSSCQDGRGSFGTIVPPSQPSVIGPPSGPGLGGGLTGLVKLNIPP